MSSLLSHYSITCSTNFFLTTLSHALLTGSAKKSLGKALLPLSAIPAIGCSAPFSLSLSPSLSPSLSLSLSLDHKHGQDDGHGHEHRREYDVGHEHGRVSDVPNAAISSSQSYSHGIDTQRDTQRETQRDTQRDTHRDIHRDTCIVYVDDIRVTRGAAERAIEEDSTGVVRGAERGAERGADSTENLVAKDYGKID